MSNVYLDFETLYKDDFIDHWVDILLGFLRDNHCLIIGSQHYDSYDLKVLIYNALKLEIPDLDPNILNIKFIDLKIDKFILAS